MRDMRKHRRLIALLVLLLCAGAASAELRRGDSGDGGYALHASIHQAAEQMLAEV